MAPNNLAIYRKIMYAERMATQTLTLKLPFLRLNTAKAAEFSRLAAINVEVANIILAMPGEERKKLTTASFRDVELGSAWMNQTIRNANAATKVKSFMRLPLETNNQNWTLHKVGETYSIGFGLLRGVKKRVPLTVHAANHAALLDAILKGEAKQGTLKLWQSKRNLWYAVLSVTMDVPATHETTRFIGIDRGQRHIAVGATPEGLSQFWTERRIRQVRRHYARLRKKLQAAGKYKTVKRIEQHEARIVRHINHCVSKDIVQWAGKHDCGIRLEDLSGIRKAPQRKTTKQDAGHNRDFWPFYDLETKIVYKSVLAGITVESVPAAYTSKTCCKCGAIGRREKETFSCSRCGYRGHADQNAARNIGAMNDRVCHYPFEMGSGGLHEPALNWVRNLSGGQPSLGTQEPESHRL